MTTENGMSDCTTKHMRHLLQLLEMVRPSASKLGLESPVELWSYFVQQCKLRLHVVLCLSPIGSAFRDRLRQNPSLVNCCTIDWFQVLDGTCRTLSDAQDSLACFAQHICPKTSNRLFPLVHLVQADVVTTEVAVSSACRGCASDACTAS